jgi:serine protease AprX
MQFRFLLVLIFFYSAAFATDSNCRYFISFTDKNSNPYNLSSPSDYLSRAAIERREKAHIAISVTDLPVNPQYIAALQSAGLTIISRSKWLNGVIAETSDTNSVNLMKVFPFISDVRLIYDPRVDVLFKRKWLQNERAKAEESAMAQRIASLSYGMSYNQVHMIHCDYLHDSGFLGEGKMIALLDGGFYRVDSLHAFDSLRASNQIIATWDFVHNETDVYGDASHGMSVLSAIAGNIPGSIMGTAPHASFLLLETEDVASESIAEEYYWEAGAEYADSAGADIISSSLSYTTFDDSSQNHTYAEMDGHTTVAALAANHAASVGILVIVSAGNDGSNPWNFIGTPADADSALAIGAVDSAGAYAFFSSNGPSSDGDVKPNVAAQGDNTTIYFPGDIVGMASGTSFSAPIIAGAAACLWQAFDSLSNMQIFSAIQRSASQFFFPDTLLGYGIPDFAMASTLLKVNSATSPVAEGIVKLYPSPTKDRCRLFFNSSGNSKAELRLMNTLGQVVFLKELSLVHGIQVLEISIPDLNSGVYFVEMVTGDKKFTAPIVKY